MTTVAGIRERRGDSPRGAPYIWLQIARRGLRVGFNRDALEALGHPERVDIRFVDNIRFEAGEVLIEPTEYYDIGLALVRPSANWVEVVSPKLLKRYQASGLNLPMGVWLPAETSAGGLSIKDGIGITPPSINQSH